MPPGDSVTQEHKDRICVQIALGRSVVAICKDPDMPSLAVVYQALSRDKEFQENYARAKDDQAETFFDQIVSLADTELEIGDDGRVDSGLVQQLRLRVDARKWAASKLKPKKYGDKIHNEHTGEGGGPIRVITGVPDA